MWREDQDLWINWRQDAECPSNFHRNLGSISIKIWGRFQSKSEVDFHQNLGSISVKIWGRFQSKSGVDFSQNLGSISVESWGQFPSKVGVDFTNVLQAAFARADPKRAIIYFKCGVDESCLPSIKWLLH